MKTTLTLSVKKSKDTDIYPQILVFCNGDLVDEVVIEPSESFKIEQDFDFKDGWNEISFLINDMCWSETDGSNWAIDVTNLEINGTNKFPVSRGEGLKPFTFEFNPADVVLEIENYDENSLDSIHYQQTGGKPIEVDCSFGFAFSVEGDKVVDYYNTGLENIVASPSLNVPTGTFLKLLRMSIKKTNSGAVSLDDYIKLNNDSTASKYWSLPIMLQSVQKMDLVVSMCKGDTWDYTRVLRQYGGQKIPAAEIIKLLTPPSED